MIRTFEKRFHDDECNGIDPYLEPVSAAVDLTVSVTVVIRFNENGIKEFRGIIMSEPDFSGIILKIKVLRFLHVFHFREVVFITVKKDYRDPCLIKYDIVGSVRGNLIVDVNVAIAVKINLNSGFIVIKVKSVIGIKSIGKTNVISLIEFSSHLVFILKI